MPAPVFQLRMRSGPTPGKAFLLEKEESLLGRDLANDIAIADPEVSRRHARFLMRDNSVFVEDLGSTNGTFLNGERISSPQQLRLGDVITFGENVSVVFEKATFEQDATMVTPEIEKTPPPVYKEREPVPEAYQPPPEPPAYQQPQPAPQRRVVPPVEEPIEEEFEKKGGMPTWLIILLIAIVMVVCVIAVVMFFMPASWWCAIDIFGFFEGCPIR